MLDERNINDQGIDAAAAVIDSTLWSGINAAGVITGSAYANETAALTGAGAGGSAYQNSGNLYGSSKDIGYMTAKLPSIIGNWWTCKPCRFYPQNYPGNHR